MIAFITGVTAGFGTAIARRLVRDGHKVIGVGRREARIEQLEKELGPQFHGLVLDVTDASAVRTSLSTLPAAFSEIDILINNAGLALGLDLAQRANIEDWTTMVQTNIQGLLNCTHAILPEMTKRNRGHVINMGSVAGEFPYPGGNVYGATKAFVRQFTLNLKADLIGTQIRVTDIEPGLCGETEFSNVRFKGDDEKAKKVYQGTSPLTPEDIAETVSWIVHLPAHMNVNTISIMPTCQAFSPFAIDRK